PELRALRMRARHPAGRPAEALAVYEETRRALADALARRLAFGDESRHLRFLGYSVAGFGIPNRPGLDRTAQVYSEPGRTVMVSSYDGDPSGSARAWSSPPSGWATTATTRRRRSGSSPPGSRTWGGRTPRWSWRTPTTCTSPPSRRSTWTGSRGAAWSC
ncbi:BTAD domain-containing putative transcriptional regulator, partial [Streptomyces alfalfae]